MSKEKRTDKAKSADNETPAVRVSDSYPGMPEDSEVEGLAPETGGCLEDTPLPISADDLDADSYRGNIPPERDSEFDPEDEEKLEEIINGPGADDAEDDFKVGDVHVISERDYDLLGLDADAEIRRQDATLEERREYLIEETPENIDVTDVYSFADNLTDLYDISPPEKKDIMERFDSWLDRTDSKQYLRDDVVRIIDIYARKVLNPEEMKKQMSSEETRSYGECHIELMDHLLPRERRKLTRRFKSWLNDTGRDSYSAGSVIEIIEEHAKYIPKDSD